MTTLRRVSAFSASCGYCDDQVTYVVPDDQLAAFEQIDESGDHSAVCSACDFYRQEDLLASFRVPGEGA